METEHKITLQTDGKYCACGKIDYGEGKTKEACAVFSKCLLNNRTTLETEFTKKHGLRYVRCQACLDSTIKEPFITNSQVKDFLLEMKKTVSKIPDDGPAYGQMVIINHVLNLIEGLEIQHKQPNRKTFQEEVDDLLKGINEPDTSKQ